MPRRKKLVPQPLLPRPPLQLTHLTRNLPQVPTASAPHGRPPPLQLVLDRRDLIPDERPHRLGQLGGTRRNTEVHAPTLGTTRARLLILDDINLIDSDTSPRVTASRQKRPPGTAVNI